MDRLPVLVGPRVYHAKHAMYLPFANCYCDIIVLVNGTTNAPDSSRQPRSFSPLHSVLASCNSLLRAATFCFLLFAFGYRR